MMSNIAFSENGCVKYFFCAVVVRKACTTFLLPPRAGQETPDDCFLSSVRNAAKVRVNRGQERPWKGQNEEGKLSIRPLRRMRSGAPFFACGLGKAGKSRELLSRDFVRPRARKTQWGENRFPFNTVGRFFYAINLTWVRNHYCKLGFLSALLNYYLMQYVFPFICHAPYEGVTKVDKSYFRP